MNLHNRFQVLLLPAYPLDPQSAERCLSHNDSYGSISDAKDQETVRIWTWDRDCNWGRRQENRRSGPLRV